VEMGAWSTHGGGEKIAYKVWSESLKRREHLEVLGLWWEDMDGIRLVQDRDSWWALLNTVMNVSFCCLSDYLRHVLGFHRSQTLSLFLADMNQENLKKILSKIFRYKTEIG
jgi:hypothetical protein